MKTYNHYFEIDKSYNPVFNEGSREDDNELWNRTYPHRTLIDLIKCAEKMLSRGTKNDCKGIWIEGAYGTGKSRNLWLLQRLLEVSNAEVEAYFNRYNDLSKETDLLKKIIGLKNSGPILTVFRYSSSEISSNSKFIIAVYESVTQALTKAGYKNLGKKTLRGQLVTWLEDSASLSFLEKSLEKDEWRFRGSFAGKSAEQILNLLKNDDEGKNLNLLIDVIELLEKGGFSGVARASIDDLMTWLSEVIDANKLKAIVFFWDEFTCFFNENKNSLDGFQTLGEFASQKPFYFVFVTHMSGTLFSSSEHKAHKGSFRALLDRFHHKSIEMPDDVAFQLIADSIKVKENYKDEYEKDVEYMIKETSEARQFVTEAIKMKDGNEVIKRMIPIHPMAALLLKHIAENFASNQRSMFNFIKNENEEGFQWFLKNKTPGRPDVLTIDYLWEFFYERGTDEKNVGAVGRENLNDSVVRILDSYNYNKDKLNDIEKRCYKIILLMQAINLRVNNLNVLKPTLKNIKLAVSGDSDLTQKAEGIIKNTLDKALHVVCETHDGKEILYESPLLNNEDRGRIQSIKDRIIRDTKTKSMVETGSVKLTDAFNFTASLKARFRFVTATVNDFELVLKKTLNETKAYQLPCIICFARNEDEKTALHSDIEKVYADQKPRERDFFIVDASSSIMDDHLFESYVDLLAENEYYLAKDRSIAEEKKKKAEVQIENWKNNIERHGTFVFYAFYKEDQKKKFTLNNVSKIRSELKNAVRTVFPYSFDDREVSDVLYQKQLFAPGARLGLVRGDDKLSPEKKHLAADKSTFLTPGLFQNNWVKNLLGKADGIQEYWKNPQSEKEPVSILKVKVDEYIKKKLKEDARVSFNSIYAYLAKYGFMPYSPYAYLMGFLLREYLDPKYRYSIGESGESGGVADYEVFSGFIKDALDKAANGDSVKKEAYIELMSQNQLKFVKFASEVFQVESTLAVEQTASKLCVKIQELGFPLWTFKYAAGNEAWNEYVDLLTSIVNAPKETGVASLTDKFGKLVEDDLEKNPELINQAKAFFTLENAKKGVTNFLNFFEKGEIPRLAEELGVIDYLGDVRRKIANGNGSSAWLWLQDTAEDELRNLLNEFKIMRLSKLTTKDSAKSFDGCVQNWKNFGKCIRVPATIMQKECPELGEFCEILLSIVNDEPFPDNKLARFLHVLETESESVAMFSYKAKDTVFMECYAELLHGVEDLADTIYYDEALKDAFSMDDVKYRNLLKTAANRVRETQLIAKLKKDWKRRVGYDSPISWSVDKSTPISVMVPEEEKEQAKNLFETLRDQKRDRNLIEAALAYLPNASFVDSLGDQEKIDAAFSKKIVKQYSRILVDVNAVRDALKENGFDSPDTWYGDPDVDHFIEKLANAEYSKEGGASKRLQQEIDAMSAQEAKDLLKRLVLKYVDVGMALMMKEEK